MVATGYTYKIGGAKKFIIVAIKRRLLALSAKHYNVYNKKTEASTICCVVSFGAFSHVPLLQGSITYLVEQIS